jgi:hypothetical protein
MTNEGRGLVGKTTCGDEVDMVLLKTREGFDVDTTVTGAGC